MNLPPEAYLWFKSLHIIGVVVWFAGLFYLVRLFIYHVETNEYDNKIKDAFDNQYSLMERRLANIITTPGMVLTISMAIGLLVLQPSFLYERWLQIKLIFVSFLLIYHIYCYRIMNSLSNNQCKMTGRQLRILNELPTIFLVIVVLLVVFKNSFPTNAATWFVFSLVLFMAVSIQLYARYRRLRSQE
ncbi:MULTISPECIES: protoporphyrinogen oxidase HemJ [unclassified Prochlorococcus]|uniref:protoporphyrinogen oxidase HemJ n=1 Tax=unclassified Prochlorococcus TaxID=2627481 RepID=UPI000533A675|nr:MULTISPECIES: protoporphyrinogen oxidase HemJ [unclassified Prochlorococcus]KGG15278.1 Protoporphyrinogen IX oxidase [Prochlorococcus sp. MIT 0602]KGG17555.1 Protoporphyrinogen IX oxidase [Prochlorococcus sp. MIT 0603]